MTNTRAFTKGRTRHHPFCHASWKHERMVPCTPCTAVMKACGLAILFSLQKTAFLRRKTMPDMFSLSANHLKKFSFYVHTGIFLLGCALWGPAVSHASENERYKALPIANGGYVFILDTREGHAWTWTSAGQGQVSPSGVNPHFVYQGNVRKNMAPGKAHTPSSSSRSQHF